jgi:TP901 family phage tail tape measure protein
VAGASKSQMAEVSAVTAKLGLDTRFASVSQADAAVAMLNLAKGGIELDKAMTGAESALLLAEAGTIDAGDAANIAATQIASFRLGAGDLGAIADQLVGAANASTAEVSDMAAASKIAAGSFSLLQTNVLGGKGAMLEMNTALAALAQRGVVGSTAGQQLSRVMTELVNPTTRASKTMADLDRVLSVKEHPEQYRKAIDDMKAAVGNIEGKSLIEILKSTNSELAKTNPDLFRQRLMALSAVASQQTGPNSASLRDSFAKLNIEMATKNPEAFALQLEGAAAKMGGFEDKMRDTIGNSATFEQALGSNAARLTEFGSIMFRQDGNVKPFIEIVDNLRTSLDGMPDAAKAAQLNVMFGDDGGRAMMSLLSQAPGALQKLKGEINESGQAAALAAAKNSGMKGSLSALKSIFETVGTAAATAFGPAIQSLAGSFGSTLQTIEPFLKGLGSVLSTILEIPGVSTGIVVALTAIGVAFAGIKIAGFVSSMAGMVKTVIGVGTQITKLPGMLSSLYTVLAANPMLIWVAAGVALVAALVLLYKHSKTFRDIVDGIARVVKDFAVKAFETLLPILQDVGAWLMDLGKKALPIVIDVFTTLGTIAMTVGKFLYDFGSVAIPIVIDVFKALFTITSTIIGVFVSVITGVKDAITAFLGFGPLQAIFEGLGRVITGMVNIVKGVLTGEFAGAWNGVKTIISGAVEAAIGYILFIPKALFNMVKDIPGAIGNLGDVWDTAVQYLAELIIKFGPQVAEWISGAFDGAKQLFLDAILKVWSFFTDPPTEAILGFAQAALDTITSLLDGLIDAVPKVVSWLNDLPGLMLDTVGNLLGLLVDAGKAAINGLLDGLEKSWPGAKAWLVALPGKMLTAVGNLITLLLQAGRDVISGLWNGIKEMWPSVLAWFLSLPGRILDALATLGSILIDLGRQLINGLWTGIKEMWNSVAAWFTGLPARVLSALTTLATTLVDSGKQLIDGMFTGIKNGWALVTTWFTQLPASVTSAIGDLSQKLVASGKSIIDGFLTGAKSAWETVKAWFSDLPNTLKNLGSSFATIGSNLGTAMANALKGVINSVIDTWNNLSFTIPATALTPAITIAVPNIPHLAHGTITESKMAAVIGEAGPEAVMPLGPKYVNDFRGLASSPMFLEQLARAFPAKTPPSSAPTAAAFNRPVSGPVPLPAQITPGTGATYAPTYNVETSDPEMVVREIETRERAMVNAVLLVN